MPDPDNEKFVSDQTQAIFQLLVAAGADLASLLALVSSAYADGGNHVLDRLQKRVIAEGRHNGLGAE